MDTFTFRDGIAELKKFYNTFKPSADQLEAWFSRLQNRFDNETFIEAIYQITETQANNPSYYSIKQACYKVIADKKRQSQTITHNTNSTAKISDLQWDFQRDCMKELASIILKRMKNKINIEQKDKLLNDLKELWLDGYKKLPKTELHNN